MKMMPVTNGCVEFLEAGKLYARRQHRNLRPQARRLRQAPADVGRPSQREPVGLGARVVRPTDALD